MIKYSETSILRWCLLSIADENNWDLFQPKVLYSKEGGPERKQQRQFYGRNMFIV